MKGYFLRVLLIAGLALVSQFSSATDYSAKGLSAGFYDGRSKGKDYTGVWLRFQDVTFPFLDWPVGSPNSWDFEIGTSYDQPDKLIVGVSSERTFSGGRESASLYDRYTDPQVGYRFFFGDSSFGSALLASDKAKVGRFYRGLEAANKEIFEAICLFLNNRDLMQDIQGRMSLAYDMSSEYREFWSSPRRQIQIASTGRLCAEGIRSVNEGFMLTDSLISIAGRDYSSQGKASAPSYNEPSPRANSVAQVSVDSTCQQSDVLRSSIQPILAHFGYYTGSIDGIYGPATESALKQLFTKAGLSYAAKLCNQPAVVFELLNKLLQKNVSKSDTQYQQRALELNTELLQLRPQLIALESDLKTAKQYEDRAVELNKELIALRMELASERETSNRLQAELTQAAAELKNQLESMPRLPKSNDTGAWVGQATQEGFSYAARLVNESEQPAKLVAACTSAGSVLFWQIEGASVVADRVKVLAINNRGVNEFSDWEVYPSPTRSVLFIQEQNRIDALISKFARSETLTLQLNSTQHISTFQVEGFEAVKQALSSCALPQG